MGARRGRTWGWVGVALLSACTPNAGGLLGMSSAASLGDGGGDDDDGATAGTSTSGDAGPGGNGEGDGESGGSAATFDPSDDEGVDTGDTGPSVTTSPGGASLIIAEGATFDFGATPVGGQSIHSFTVINDGDEEATGLLGMPLSGAFDFTGPFPGLQGTCGATLGVGASCEVEVRFGPGVLGLHAATLAIGHDAAPDATCELSGGGAGQSENLIVNPGGEMFGSAPPPGWMNVGAGNWMAGAWTSPYPAPIGSGYLTGLGGPDNQDFILRQDVSVATWADAIDQGVISVSFQGQARSYLPDNDSHRIRVEYRAAGGMVLDAWDTDWLGVASWQLRSDARLAPVGTRTVRVDLMCRKTAFQYCDAYFDELVLRAAYP